MILAKAAYNFSLIELYFVLLIRQFFRNYDFQCGADAIDNI